MKTWSNRESILGIADKADSSKKLRLARLALINNISKRWKIGKFSVCKAFSSTKLFYKKQDKVSILHSISFFLPIINLKIVS